MKSVFLKLLFKDINIFTSMPPIRGSNRFPILDCDNTRESIQPLSWGGQTRIYRSPDLILHFNRWEKSEPSLRF